MRHILSKEYRSYLASPEFKDADKEKESQEERVYKREDRADTHKVKINESASLVYSNKRKSKIKKLNSSSYIVSGASHLKNKL